VVVGLVNCAPMVLPQYPEKEWVNGEFNGTRM